MRLFFALLVCASYLQAAAVMRGKLVRNRPEGDPIVGVSVTAPGVANPTLSRDDGTFSLEFPNRQPGDRVRIEPTYAGYEVVNWPQLNVVLARDCRGSEPSDCNLGTRGSRTAGDGGPIFSESQYAARSSGSTSSGSRRLGRTGRGCCGSWSRRRRWRVRRRRSWRRCSRDSHRPCTKRRCGWLPRERWMRRSRRWMKRS